MAVAVAAALMEPRKKFDEVSMKSKLYVILHLATRTQENKLQQGAHSSLLAQRTQERHPVEQREENPKTSKKNLINFCGAP